MSQIASIIRSLAGQSSSVLKVCEVTSLDRGARTIDCQPLDETAPIVGLVEGTPLGAVLLADELEELNVQIGDQQISITREGITLNEGKLGGIIKIADLTSKINTLEREFNTLKQVLTSWTPVPQDGGASLKASAASWAGRQLQLTQQSDYEDTKVKH